MTEDKMSRRLKFTIYHGLFASLALHSALSLPFVVYSLAAPPEEPPTLVIDLQGVVADSQTEQKVVQETKGEAKPDETAPAKREEATPTPTPPSEVKPTEVAADDTELATPPPPQPAPAQPQAETKSGSAGAITTPGVQEQQKAQTIKADPLKDYFKLLSKKVQANLVYPDEGRRAGLQGTATVSFRILQSGQIRPETLKIVTSSGQPQLDANALKTIRSSAPFDPPPKEITVVIGVRFGGKL
jgi:protein TonB